MWREPAAPAVLGAPARSLLAERERSTDAAGVREALLELSALAHHAAEALPGSIAAAAAACVRALSSGGKILACGNGGSAADAAHFVAELIGRMRFDRAPLPALSLGVDPSVVTCIANDFGYEELFARQVRGLGGPNDVLVALSTSGRSANVLRALEAARALGMGTVALTGAGGDARLADCDVTIRVPSGDTARIQEIHTAALHAICDVVERTLFEHERTKGGRG
jgi:D-sedoheptulose 7-phosphate isomerase